MQTAFQIIALFDPRDSLEVGTVIVTDEERLRASCNPHLFLPTA